VEAPLNDGWCRFSLLLKLSGRHCSTGTTIAADVPWEDTCEDTRELANIESVWTADWSVAVVVEDTREIGGIESFGTSDWSAAVWLAAVATASVAAAASAAAAAFAEMADAVADAAALEASAAA